MLEHSSVVHCMEPHSDVELDSVGIVELASVNFVVDDIAMEQVRIVADMEVVQPSLVGIVVDTAVAEIETEVGWEEWVEKLPSDDFALGQVTLKIKSRASPPVVAAVAGAHFVQMVPFLLL
jgi:hypothetical protein